MDGRRRGAVNGEWSFAYSFKIINNKYMSDDYMNDGSTEPLEAAAGVEDMDLESQMILKQELEEKLKAGKKLSEDEMDLAEQLMGEDILKYLASHKEEAGKLPKDPLPENEEEEIEVELLKKILGGDK